MATSISDLKNQKKKCEKIVAVTSYDYTMAQCVDGLVDFVLVGDSLGMVIQGKENTLDVSIEEMIYHTRSVHRAVKRSHLCSDMPFLSYGSPHEALKNAGRLLKAGAQSVKVEGGEEIADVVEKLTQFGIPVVGHIGMTPQSVHQWGGYRVQGREENRRDQLLRDAKILEEKGASVLVLESIPGELARTVTENAKIPTIGIGAGPHCDGQILVITDLLGMNPHFNPKFLKKYANLSETIAVSVKAFSEDVKKGVFPSREYSYDG